MPAPRAPNFVAHAAIAGSGWVDYSVSQLDAFHIKVELHGGWPNLATTSGSTWTVSSANFICAESTAPQRIRPDPAVIDAVGWMLLSTRRRRGAQLRDLALR